MYKKVIIIGTTDLARKCCDVFYNLELEVDFEFFDTSKNSKHDTMNFLLGQKCNSLVFSIMNSYIISSDVVDMNCLDIVNVHHALLPGHRGRNAQTWSLFYGDNETGITWHFVNQGIDTGKIIKSVHIPISNEDTSLSLLKKQNDAILNSFEELILDLLHENIVFEETIDRDDYFHLSSDIPNNGQLDLEWDEKTTSRFLRAMDFGPLKVMGQVSVIIDNKHYSVRKYQIASDGTYDNDIVFNKDEMILYLKKGGSTFKLYLK